MFIKNNSSKNKQSKLFILVNCMEGKEDAVFDKIKKMNSVIDVQKTIGVFDLIVTLEVDSTDDLKKTQIHKIKTIDNVKYTMTLSTSSNNEITC